MKRYPALILSFALLLSFATPGAQSDEFKRTQLSGRGRIAYNTLMSACIFAVGGVGYAAQTSKGELALDELLKDERAVSALKSLTGSGRYEGALYGLLGLHLKNKTEFDQAAEIFMARNEVPEWQSKGSFDCFRNSSEDVTTMTGCIIRTQRRDKVVSDIRTGVYDNLMKPIQRRAIGHEYPVGSQ